MSILYQHTTVLYDLYEKFTTTRGRAYPPQDAQLGQWFPYDVQALLDRLVSSYKESHTLPSIPVPYRKKPWR